MALDFFAERAWVQGAWQQNVLLSANDSGEWIRVEADVEYATHPDAVRLKGAVIPGLVNAHSHAFQRAIAGLTERSTGHVDNFWSWRERMYAAANRMTPDILQAIATQLYAELLRGGYTQVCEFHYLHAQQADGEQLELGMALVRAAAAVSMRLTMLPTLYMRSGFEARGLRTDQARFASTPNGILRLREAYASHCGAGVAIHSLRAVAGADITELITGLPADTPVHIHVAEQMQEVEDCAAHLGARPVEWLLASQPVNARWHLVHATHMTPAEVAALGKAGASVVICPSTEANLGDGVVDFVSMCERGVPWSIGSDSHVTRSAFDELRLLEYSQRLSLQRRNVAASASARASHEGATAAALFEAALAGGGQDIGLALNTGISVGAPADFCVLDETDSALLGVPPNRLLDAAVFSTPNSVVKDVYVAARCVVQDRKLRQNGLGEEERQHRAVNAAFSQAMKALWR